MLCQDTFRGPFLVCQELGRHRDAQVAFRLSWLCRSVDHGHTFRSSGCRIGTAPDPGSAARGVRSTGRVLSGVVRRQQTRREQSGPGRPWGISVASDCRDTVDLEPAVTGTVRTTATRDSPLTIRRTELARRRAVHGFTQEGLAEHLGVERSTVARWERGAVTPQPWIRPRLADVLALTIDQLDALLIPPPVTKRPVAIELPTPLPSPGETATRLDVVRAQLPALRRVLAAHDLPDDGPIRSVNQLERSVRGVIGMRLNSDYTRMAETLPALLAELNRALDVHQGQRRNMVARMLAQAYRAADAIADKFGYYDLSARIIGLMQSAAVTSGDELTIATASYVRAETFFTSGDLETGRRMLEHAADRLLPDCSTGAAAIYGALHMRAAVTAARAGYAVRAGEHLDEARSIARRVPEGEYHGTAFGPASVRIHRVTLAVDLADTDAALRFADDWVPPTAIPAERRSHYFVDLGRAYLQAGEYDRAIRALMTARGVAPEHIREHPEVKHALIILVGAGTPRAVEFAKWARVPDIDV